MASRHIRFGKIISEGRDPQERVFPHVPSRIHAQAHRRTYAQAYYRHLSGREQPLHHTLPVSSVPVLVAVLTVSRALGHNRKDIVLRNYLR